MARNRRLQVRDLYGFDFPDDLFHFWEFVNRLAPLEPLTAIAATTGLHLVGPFEVLAGRFDRHTSAYHQHLHWRFRNDPPEFFTVFASGPDGLHHGYYLDEPGGGGGCVVSYYAYDVFELEPTGETLFDAFRLEMEQHAADDAAPEEIERVRARLPGFVTAERPETGEAYVEKYLGVRPARFAQVVAATHEGMGIVVPPDAYRPLSLTDKKLWRALQKRDALPALIEEAWTALREGYPGTALKLGKELWATGNRRRYSYDLLDAAYEVLGREVPREVLGHHREQPDLPSVDILQPE